MVSIYIFLLIRNFWHLFRYLLVICLPLRNIYSGPLLTFKFLFFIFSCLSSLHILKINTLSNVWLANNFSHSLFSLHSLNYFHGCADVYSLMQIPFASPFVFRWKASLPRPMTWGFRPIFSLHSFVVSSLTFNFCLLFFIYVIR